MTSPELRDSFDLSLERFHCDYFERRRRQVKVSICSNSRTTRQVGQKRSIGTVLMDPAHGQPSRARVACKACRQNKIRCGMRNPPCQRCSRLNINCTVDAAYHRTSHKERVQHLEKQIQKLQAQLSQQDETASRRSRPDDPVAPSLHPRGLAEAATPTLETPGQSIGANDSKLAMGGEDSAYSVGSISLQEAQVDKLFSMYISRSHHRSAFTSAKRYHLQFFQGLPPNAPFFG